MDKILAKIKKIKNEQKEILDILDDKVNIMPQCYICTTQDAIIGTVAIPCGHGGVCKNCSTKLTRCPICRSKIDKFVKIFYV